MIEYEIILSKFISQQELLDLLQGNSDYNIEIGGNDDQLYLQDKKLNETFAIIWTTKIDKNGEPDNKNEVLEEYNYYNLTPPYVPFYSYLIECSDKKFIKYLYKVFKSFDPSALVLDYKMKKFKKHK